MSRLSKHVMPKFFKWVPLLCAKDCCVASISYLPVTGLRHILQHLRFASTESAFNLENGGNLGELAKKSRLVRAEAQATLLDYFLFTRSFQILDAENMSKNTPVFFNKLLKRVDVPDGKVGRSLARFLRYHPLNEFEAFFESIGLKPSEYSPFLPQNLMFLNEDELLLENYYVLCNYGIPRNRIGKIYREARDVFRYDYGVLLPKIQSFQKLGLKQSLVAKIIASTPRLLLGNVDPDFVEFLEKLKNVGIDYDLLEEHISVDESYDWKCMLELMHSLRKLGLSEEQLCQTFTLHPDILLVSSGRITLCLFGSLFKLGPTPSNIKNILLEFPQIPLSKFAHNLLRGYEFLVEINMGTLDIGKIVCSHAAVLGSCELKKVKSLCNQLNCGQAKLCQWIKDNPCILKKWVRGMKLVQPQTQKRGVNVRKVKTEFLLSLGFVEDSKEMEKALKKFRGRGVELQERFDCLVGLGLRREDVIQMLKSSPEILNQTTDVIKSKVDVFVKELGYSVSDLVDYPKPMTYTSDRLKSRLLMYKWLKEKGVVRPNLRLSTLLSCSHETFLRVYVNPHPGGQEYWKGLKKRI